MSDAATATYEPRGKVRAAIEFMRKEPRREFTTMDLAEGPLQCLTRQVNTFLETAVHRGAIFRRHDGKRLLFRFTPFEVEAAPAPSPEPVKVPTLGSWKPPRMECTRPNAGAPVAPAPVAASEEFTQWLQSGVDEPPPAERLEVRLTSAATPEPAPVLADASIQGGAGTGCPVHNEAHPCEGCAQELADELDAEEVEFEAFLSSKGSLQLVGTTIDEEGRVWLSRDQVAEINKLIASSPAV